MADTPLSSQMESEYKVAKWNRSTVADGSWLQKYTIEKLKDRDIFLANHIDSNTDDLTSALNAEIAARIDGDEYISAALTSVSSDFYNFSGKVETSAANITNTINVFSGKVEQSAYNLTTALNFEIERATDAENNLQDQIDVLNAATDVIAVFGTYDEFSAASAGAWQEQVTDLDFIKVLRDNTYQPTGDPDAGTTDDDYYQVYYQWHDDSHSTTSPDWTGWSAIGNLDPYYSVSEINAIVEDIAGEMASMSSTVAETYLSANGDAVQSGHNIVISAHPTEPKIKIETSSHVTFSGVSSTNLSATNVSGENLKYDYVTAGDLTATEAKISGLSALNISGNGKSSTVSGLILSSQSGKYASAVLNSAYWSATNGSNGNSGLIGNSFAISVGANLGLSVDGSAIKISGTPAGVTSISAKDTNVNTNFTGGTVTLSAGPNIDFVTVDTNTLGIKLEDSIYWSAGVYNDYTSFSADFSSLQIKHNSQYNGIQYISFSGDKLNLYTTNASQSQGTSSATLDSNGVCAFDSQAGSTPYYSTWIDIISGTNLQSGNYVYIDRTLNTVNLSSNISATNISSQSFTMSGADGNYKRNISSTKDLIYLEEKYQGSYTYTTKITPKSYSAEYSVAGGGGWVSYDYNDISAGTRVDAVSISWSDLINAGNGDFKGTNVTAKSFNTSSNDPGYGIVNISTDWAGAGAGGTNATGSAGLNGCVVWANGNYTAHNPGGAGGNWASWNDIIHAANSTWVSSNGTITAIVSGTVGAETGVLYFV